MTAIFLEGAINNAHKVLLQSESEEEVKQAVSLLNSSSHRIAEILVWKRYVSFRFLP
jgi:hypothetical protein